MANDNKNSSPPEISVENSMNIASIDEEALANLSEDEKKWYQKFQKGLMFFDGWQQISNELLSSIPMEEQTEARHLLKTIGVKIGTEWSRDNAVRKIDNDKLRNWGKVLKKVRAENPLEISNTLALISTEVDAILVE